MTRSPSLLEKLKRLVRGIALWRFVRRLWRAPLAHREAVRLAQVMWRRSYRDAAPNWQPLEDTAGVISQIDNMHAGVVEENEKLRDLLAHIQHHTSCTSLQFDLIEEALNPNSKDEPRGPGAR